MTQRREHDRRLRSVATRMRKATLKRQLHDLSTGAPYDQEHPRSLSLIPETHRPSLVTSLMHNIGQWLPTGGTGNNTTSPTDCVHEEFDADVVDALMYVVGRWMGLEDEQLRDSPGLRTLVTRNMQWFHNSPDWMKLTGLLLAKKLHRSLNCPRRPPMHHHHPHHHPTTNIVSDANDNRDATTVDVAGTTEVNGGGTGSETVTVSPIAPHEVDGVVAIPIKTEEEEEEAHPLSPPPPTKRRRTGSPSKPGRRGRPPLASSARSPPPPVDSSTEDNNNNNEPTKEHPKKKNKSKAKPLLPTTPIPNGVSIDTPAEIVESEPMASHDPLPTLSLSNSVH